MCCTKTCKLIVYKCDFSKQLTEKQCNGLQHTYQIFICDKAEDEAIDSSKLVLRIDHVKYGQHPLYEKNLKIVQEM